jgi:hypothetical protein
MYPKLINMQLMAAMHNGRNDGDRVQAASESRTHGEVSVTPTKYCRESSIDTAWQINTPI